MADRAELDRLNAELAASAALVRMHEERLDECEAMCLAQTPLDPETLDRRDFVESCVRILRAEHVELERRTETAKAAYFAAVRSPG